MSRLNGLWQFFNSNVVLLVLGFMLTTVAGTILTDRFQRQAWEREAHFEQQRQQAAWEREKQFEVFRRKLDDGQKSLEEISNLINLRFFRLEKVFTDIIAADLNNAEKHWNEYMKTVEEWNVKLITNQNRLKRLVNDQVALAFNNYETDASELTQAVSIHGKFFIAHREVHSLLKTFKNAPNKITSDMKNQTNRILRDLDYSTDDFVDSVSELFLERVRKLEQLSTNKPRKPSTEGRYVR